MGDRHLYKIECFDTLGTPESERLKVTALPSPKRFAQAGLNLFHPTASPLFQNVGFFHIVTQSLGGESGGSGEPPFFLTDIGK
jgi:hypothetical protein